MSGLWRKKFNPRPHLTCDIGGRTGQLHVHVVSSVKTYASRPPTRNIPLHKLCACVELGRIVSHTFRSVHIRRAHVRRAHSETPEVCARAVPLALNGRCGRQGSGRHGSMRSVSGRQARVPLSRLLPCAVKAARTFKQRVSTAARAGATIDTLSLLGAFHGSA